MGEDREEELEEGKGEESICNFILIKNLFLKKLTAYDNVSILIFTVDISIIGHI